jgi:hypothetical protein
MATLDNDDLKAIKGLIEITLDEKLDEKIAYYDKGRNEILVEAIK